MTIIEALEAHEKRIASLEKQLLWSWRIQAIGILISAGFLAWKLLV